LNLFWF